MDLPAVAASLLRRWYIVLVGLLLTGGLTYLVFERVPLTYEASGTVLVFPPEASIEGANPLLQLGGLDQPSSLVVAYLASDTAREEFAQRFPMAEYDVVIDTLSHGPLITFTVSDPDRTVAMDALNAAVAAVPTTLKSLQDQVAAPESERLTSTPLTVDVEPTVVVTATLRALVAAAGAGILVTLVVAVGIDGLSNQRRGRRRAVEASLEPDQEEPPNEELAQEKAIGVEKRADRVDPSGSESS